MEQTVTALIEASDLAGLVRLVDAICDRRAWDELIDLVDRCDEAVERGKQVWAIRSFAEYRIALEGPAELAAGVLTDGSGRFALGPLWEVAASTHTWAAMESHIGSPWVRTMVGYERAIRGDTVDENAIDPTVLEIPVATRGWEPTYPVAEYRPHRAVFSDEIFDLPMSWVELPADARSPEEDEVTEALLDLVRPWWDDSVGKAEAAVVDGTVEDAIRSLGPHRVRMADVPLATALEAMVWAGASGGGHGRRRGTPTGRAHAWWVLTEIAGFDEIPEDPDDLAGELAGLRWVLWDPGDRVGGWNLHLGIEDADDGAAWVLSAVDAV